MTHTYTHDLAHISRGELEWIRGTSETSDYDALLVISIVYGHLFVTFVTQTMCFLSLLDIWTGLDDNRDYFSIIDMLL